ncbi:DNA primase, partial [Kaarinaea lacus]
LKKAGREYVACCPFHNEKTPSFTVSQEKQFYHCFGCGAHGSAVGFLMDYEHMEFVDAIEELASIAGVQVPRESYDPQQKARHDVYQVLEYAAAFYKQQLKSSPQGKTAIEYLQGRGLSGQIAADFGIGYAPGGWENLIQHLKPKGVTPQALLEAGLVIKKEQGGYYDRFRNRIMFPIRDRRGRVIAFGGRAIGDEAPKYLNSPENSVFHKGRELYGIYEARKNVRHLEQLIVVEGYMDAVSLAQFDVRNVVATLGTATTQEHVQRLFRLVPEVVFCFDGDRAGRNAAWRALNQVLPIIGEDKQIKFLFLPEGDDPDSVIRREGREGWQQRLVQATPLSEFLFEGLSNNLDLNTVDGRAALVERAKPQVKKIPSGVFQQMLLSKLAEIVRMDSEKLSKLILSSSEQKRPIQPQAARKQPLSSVRHAIRLLLEYPRLAQNVDIDTIRDLDLGGIALFCRLLEVSKTNPSMTCGALLEYWRGTEEGAYLAKIVTKPLNLVDESIDKEFQDTINFLHKKRLEQRIDELVEKPLDQLSPAEKLELQQAFAAKHLTH